MRSASSWHSMAAVATLLVLRRGGGGHGVVCPQRVKKMLLTQARRFYWKLAANHECQEVKEGVLLEPIQAVAKTNQRVMDR